MKKNIFVSAIAAIVLFIGCSPEGSVRSVDYQTFAEEIAVDDIVLVDVKPDECRVPRGRQGWLFGG
jgi:hypothetical protein